MKQPVKNQPKERRTSDEQVKLYSTISPLLQSAFHEVKEFSKKKQDELLNVKKVKMINRLLGKAKEVLKNESTVDYLDLLDEEDLPTYSDAVLVMSQYTSAMSQFRQNHYHSGEWDMNFGGDWD